MKKRKAKLIAHLYNYPTWVVSDKAHATKNGIYNGHPARFLSWYCASHNNLIIPREADMTHMYKQHDTQTLVYSIHQLGSWSGNVCVVLHSSLNSYFRNMKTEMYIVELTSFFSPYLVENITQIYLFIYESEMNNECKRCPLGQGLFWPSFPVGLTQSLKPQKFDFWPWYDFCG